MEPLQGRSQVDGAALKLNLLYVDDDVVNLRVLAELLGAVGATVVTAESGSEGLARLETQAFDVLLLDIHMPNMNGFDVLAALRASDGPNRDIPAIALTADLSRDEAGYKACGFDGFLPKPVTLRPVLQAILSAMSARRGAPDLRRA
jgi:CheY-like chemotaxis protein